jgi:hypothetical protein
VLLATTELSARKNDAGRLTEKTSETIDGVGVRFSSIVRQ